MSLFSRHNCCGCVVGAADRLCCSWPSLAFGRILICIFTISPTIFYIFMHFIFSLLLPFAIFPATLFGFFHYTYMYVCMYFVFWPPALLPFSLYFELAILRQDHHLSASWVFAFLVEIWRNNINTIPLKTNLYFVLQLGNTISRKERQGFQGDGCDSEWFSFRDIRING